MTMTKSESEALRNDLWAIPTMATKLAFGGLSTEEKAKMAAEIISRITVVCGTVAFADMGGVSYVPYAERFEAKCESVSDPSYPMVFEGVNGSPREEVA